jgi:hypothetical protein
MTRNQCLEEKYFLKQHSDGMLGGSNIEWFLHGGPWYRYHQSKLANSVFMQCLHDKLLARKKEDCKNILSLCAHPGTCDTNLFDQHKSRGYLMSQIIQPLVIHYCFLPAENGSMGLLKGVMDYRKNAVGGTLYGPNIYGPNIHIAIEAHRCPILRNPTNSIQKQKICYGVQASKRSGSHSILIEI